MPELTFRLDAVAPIPYAAVPILGFTLHIANTPPTERIHTIVLRSQIQLDVTRRPYSGTEKSRLSDLFGEPDRWSRTLRSMLWTHVSTIVPAFAAETSVELQVPCTFDFNVAATKYFYGLEDGDIPLTFMFSGSIFYEHDTLQVVPIPWDKEATCRLPVAVWRQLIDHYYPNTAWLILRRDLFDRLYQGKQDRGITTWEQAVEAEATGA
jgi:Family of unknown function (DUF6084)